VLAVSLQSAVDDGVGMIDGRLQRFRGGEAQPLPQLDELAMPGRFNRENAAAAWLAAEALLAVPEGAVSQGPEPQPGLGAIAAFPGLPHRLERVGGAGGVTCYNDSYATRPDATLAALMEFEQPLALIMGGSEKFADFGALCEQVCRHGSLQRVALIGATAERLMGELQAAAARLGQGLPPVIRCGSLEEAFKSALEALNGAGVLLFSPGCASFDMFPNYKVRGERFRALVEAVS
jgi:UDP-N-acetylmuramoylalanine--D-glutamate ligase